MKQFPQHGITRVKGICAILCAGLILSFANCYKPIEPEESSCLARAVFGDPADSPYTLPYQIGTSHVVSQTYCGSVSHRFQLHYDFLMPVGTPLVADREGVIVEIVDAYENSDHFPSHFNYLMLEHDDMTTAFYAHLEHGAVCVCLNDRVERGQILALSGCTGTTLPHLHYGVYRTWPARDGDDVPVNFRNAEGPLDSRGGLQVGVSYLALPY